MSRHEAGRARVLRPGPPAARTAAYAAGEFVGQESFMRASRDPGAGDAGRHRPGRRGAGSVLWRGRARALHRAASWAATYLGVDASAAAPSRSRASGPATCPAASRSRRSRRCQPGSSTSCCCSRRCWRSRTRSRCWARSRRRCEPGGRFAFTLEEGQPLTEAERAAMPDADTVWLTPLDEMVASLERVGLVVRWQEEHSESHRAVGRRADRRVHRRRARRIAEQIGRRDAGRAAGLAPAVERLAAATGACASSPSLQNA